MLLGVALGAYFAVSGSSTSSTSAARRLYAASLAAAGRSGSFHYTSYSKSAGQTFTIVGDAGDGTGIQHLVLGGHRFTLVLVNGTVYFKGDAIVLENQLGLPASTAAANAGKWISVQSGDAPYQNLEPGISAHSAIAQVVLTPRNVSTMRGADGTTFSRITGGLPSQNGQGTGTASLDVSGGSQLPRTYESTSGHSQGTSRISFSKWGEPVSESAPSGAIPYASLIGSNAGPGGGTLTPPTVAA